MNNHYNTLWINEEKRRYYRIRVQTDLFGCPSVIRTWGSLQSDRAGMQINHINNDAVGDLLKAITQRRKTNGYQLVDKQKTSSRKSPT